MTRSTSADRTRCEVIGCGKSIATDKLTPNTAWLCGLHWKLVSPWIKAARRRLNRQARRFGWTPRLERLQRWTWRRAVRRAIERAMGITA